MGYYLQTTTLKRTIDMLKDELRIGVMEADIDSDVDALAIAEIQMIIATITYTFPPLTLPMKDAMDFRIPVCSNPPTTIHNPMKNNSVL